MAKKIDLHKYIAIFLIIVGILPLVGVGLGGMVGTLVNLLIIVSGILILVK